MPDGRSIAFDTDRTGKREVWLVSSQGGFPQRPLLSGATSVHVSAWAPDGRRVAATLRREADAGDLVLFDLSTGTREVLASRKGWEGAGSWIPSGKEMVFQRRGPESWVLEILDLRTRALLTLPVGTKPE